MTSNGNELSERELEILRLLATGATNKEIAQKLYISTNTVKVHLRNIFSKINVGSRTEAALFAINNRLVEKDDAVGDLELEEILESGNHEPNRTASRYFPYFRIGIVWMMVIGILIFTVAISGWLISTRILGDNPSEVATLNNPQRWSILPSLPTARFGLAASTDQTYIYVIGGFSDEGATGVLERYNLGENRWETLTEKPTPVYEIQSAVIGGNIFVPGGRLNNGVASDVLEIYDPQQNKWFQGANMPDPRCAYGLVAFEGRLYLFGGWDGDGFVNSVFQYDPASDQWSELAPLPSPRGYLGAVTVGGRIIVVGGYDGRKAFEDNLVYQPYQTDSQQRALTTLRDMPGPRYAMGTTSIADILLIVGGTNVRGDSLGSLEYFALTNTWQAFKQLSPDTLTNLAVASLGVNVYILGGKINDQPSDQALSYQAIYNLSIPVVK